MDALPELRLEHSTVKKHDHLFPAPRLTQFHTISASTLTSTFLFIDFFYRDPSARGGNIA
jgi:hypothetical protein